MQAQLVDLPTPPFGDAKAMIDGGGVALSDGMAHYAAYAQSGKPTDGSLGIWMFGRVVFWSSVRPYIRMSGCPIVFYSESVPI